MTAFDVRRGKAGISQWVKVPPGNICSSRKQPEPKFPGILTVLFSNSDYVNGLSMSRDAAKAHIEKSRLGNGDTNRTVYLQVHFTLEKIQDRDSLLAKITKVVIFDDLDNPKIFASY